MAPCAPAIHSWKESWSEISEVPFTSCTEYSRCRELIPLNARADAKHPSVRRTPPSSTPSPRARKPRRATASRRRNRHSGSRPYTRVNRPALRRGFLRPSRCAICRPRTRAIRLGGELANPRRAPAQQPATPPLRGAAREVERALHLETARLTGFELPAPSDNSTRARPLPRRPDVPI